MPSGVDEQILERDLFGEVIKPPSRGPMADRFLMAPFSVLSAREGPWQERKRAWLNLGIEGEVGRDAGLTWGESSEVTEPGLNFYRRQNAEQGRSASPGGSPMPSCNYSENGARGDGRGREMGGLRSELGRDSDPSGKGNEKRGTMTCISEGTSPDIAARFEQCGNTTSIFDPVLCELMYRWFCPPNGQIVDPFAGGSVRGVVAAMMGRKYWGCDLRQEQIEANEKQRAQLCVGAGVGQPQWVCGDSNKTLADAPEADFVFSCPPYGNLEVYSDLPEDLSNMSWGKFCDAYEQIIAKACARLKPNRFACFVVGDFRDKENGCYRNFPAMTSIYFCKAGLKLYNDAILLTMVGSLPVRSGHFEGSRKLGKTHQNILCFLKGDSKKAAAACEQMPKEEVAK